MKMNKAQLRSLKRKWDQDNQGMTFLQFRRTVRQNWDTALVYWCGMWLGIEVDGYTHS
jgi:hypothetical protein